MESRHTGDPTVDPAVDPAVGRHEALAELGYAGFSHRRTGLGAPAPEALLAEVLGSGCADARTLEALPWLLVRFRDLDWERLRARATAGGWQNRLGFITAVAAALARDMGLPDRAAALVAQEALLWPARHDRETTLCREAMTEAERRWLRERRPAAARRWHMLSDLTPEQITHAA